MLIDVPFDKEKFLKDVNPEMLDRIEVTSTPEHILITVDIDGEKGRAVEMQRIQEGVYWAVGEMTVLYSAFGQKNIRPYFYDNTIIGLKEYIELLKLPKYRQQEFFGMADSPKQILNRSRIKKRFLDPQDEKFVLCVSAVLREDEPERDGFRFHKHGQYIGCHKLEHEYLYDQKDVDMVVLYHFYQVLDK